MVTPAPKPLWEIKEGYREDQKSKLQPTENISLAPKKEVTAEMKKLQQDSYRAIAHYTNFEINCRY